MDELGFWLKGMGVLAMLRRRGFACLSSNPREYLIFPPDWRKDLEDDFYQLLKKYSFRIFIRDVIKHKRSFTMKDLLRYSDEEWIKEYLSYLIRRGIIYEIGKERYRLRASDVFSFGDTLEWFISKVFEKEFYAPSLWGVKLKSTRVGGDFDVLASVEWNLVYVEVKSSPPKHIEQKEIRAFLDRIEELSPNLAIFLEDTQLRMKDKIVPLFESEMKSRNEKALVKRVSGELFIINGRIRIFIINSDPDIVSNIGLCLKYHFLGRI